MSGMTAALRRYSDFEGRSSRTEYWLFTLLSVLVWTGLFTIALIGDLMMPDYAASPLPWVIIVALIAWIVGTFIPSLAVTVRRLHDTGNSGWLMLLQLIPLGGLVILIFMLLESSPGRNRYGPNPHEPKTQPDRSTLFD